MYNNLHLVNQSFSAFTLLAGRQEGHLACKKTEWWGAGVVTCLEQAADLHMAQLMPLLLTVSCFSKIQIGFTILVPAHPSSPGQRAVKRMCVCLCVNPQLHYVIRQSNDITQDGHVADRHARWEQFWHTLSITDDKLL